VAAALLALPWFWNTGTRFLMPALPFLAIALALALTIALPRQALWVCMAVQALACWPQIFGLYHPAYSWRLERIPWRAALRMQPERDYLESVLPAYQVARLLEDNTKPGDRIFSLISVPEAYTDREVLEFWHSAQADRLLDTLRVGASRNEAVRDISAAWTPRPSDGLRIRAPQASPAEWQIYEIALSDGETPISGGPQWDLQAWPNVSELPLAFDQNRATRWRTWEPVRAGMYVEVDFDRALSLSGAVMTVPTTAYAGPFEFYGHARDGWHLLTNRLVVTETSLGDVRISATRAVRRAGFRYILAYNSSEGNGLLGAAMAGRELEWGLEKVAELGPIVLFRID